MNTLEQQIRERAFHLWEQAGHPHDRADDHWLMAEREIRATAEQPDMNKQTTAKKASSPKPAAQPRTTRSRKAPSEARV
jgi:hypothetical protein